MAKVNPNHRNETKWDIFKSDIIFQWLQNTKIFQKLSLLALFDFCAKLRTNK